MLRLASGVLFLGLLVAASAAPADAAKPKRVALVIGNAAYTHITPLSKPLNDAQAVVKSLTSLGYEVIVGSNTSKAELDKLAQDFRVAVKGADVGVFYYSGHGFQTNRAEQQHPINHVVPVDFSVEETDPNLGTLALDVILDALKSEARVGVIFMDACRNDPQLVAASQRLARDSKAVTISRGFSPVNVINSVNATPKLPSGNGPTGLVIAYATDPGNVALEGEGDLSPFTGALVKYLATPGLSVSEVMGRVSSDVSLATQGQQTPWSVSSLTAGAYQFMSRPADAKAPARDGTQDRSAPRVSSKRSSGRGGNLPPNLGVGAGAGL